MIVVEEEIDEVVISASTPAVCTVLVTEYKDTIAIPTSSTGAPSCYFSIVEAADTVSATAWTPSVAMVSVESGDTIFIEVETSPPIVATVAIKNLLTQSSQAASCVLALSLPLMIQWMTYTFPGILQIFAWSMLMTVLIGSR